MKKCYAIYGKYGKEFYPLQINSHVNEIGLTAKFVSMLKEATKFDSSSKAEDYTKFLRLSNSNFIYEIRKVYFAFS